MNTDRHCAVAESDVQEHLARFAIIDERGSIIRRVSLRVLAGVWNYSGWCSFALILAGVVALAWAIDAMGPAIRLEFERAMATRHGWYTPSRLAVTAVLAMMLFCTAVLAPYALRRLCATVVRGLSVRYLGSDPASERPEDHPDRGWTAQVTLAVLAGSSPPSFDRGVMCSSTDGSESGQAGSWRVTVVAPPGAVRDAQSVALGKLRSLAAAAMHLTARGETEPISGVPAATRLTRACCLAAGCGLLLFWMTGAPFLPVERIPLLVMPLALLLLAGYDARLLDWVFGRVYAEPFACIQAGPIGGAITIRGPATAVIVLRDWDASGTVVVAGTRLSRLPVGQRARRSWIRFRLVGNGLPTSSTQVASLPPPALMHVLAAWTTLGDLRALAGADDAAGMTPGRPATPESGL